MSGAREAPPARGAHLLTGYLRGCRADRELLRRLELDWPGSRALAARLALLLCLAHADGRARAHLAASLRAGLAAYRRACTGGAGDRARLVAYVDGLQAGLPAEPERALVARALSARQRRLLAARLPPGATDGSAAD